MVICYACARGNTGVGRVDLCMLLWLEVRRCPDILSVTCTDVRRTVSDVHAMHVVLRFRFCLSGCIPPAKAFLLTRVWL
jgi:hypothetical protein